MKVFRRYKSVVLNLVLMTLVSLCTVCCWPCCKDDDNVYVIKDKEDIGIITTNVENLMKKNKQQATWTLFKITIYPNNEDTDILLNIKDILDARYIKNETNKKNENEKIINKKENNDIEADDILPEEIKDKITNNKFNALIVAREDVNMEAEMTKENTSDANINNENIDNNEENNDINNEDSENYENEEEEEEWESYENSENKEDDENENDINNEDRKKAYYILVKNITHKANIGVSLFSSLETTAENKNFTYSISIVSADTTGVTDMSYMFYDCSSLESLPDISKWNTSSVENMRCMFYRCNELKEIEGLSNWNTSKVESMDFMFWGCSKLQPSFTYSGDEKNINIITAMLKACNNVEIKIINFDDNIKKLLKNDEYNCSVTLDVSKMNINDRTDMKELFSGCAALTAIKFSKEWNTSNITDISAMFYKCKNLTKIEGLNNLDTSSVKNMSGMFYKCKKLEEIELSGKWVTNNVENMSYMFDGCEALTTIKGLEKWKTNKVTNMKYMFSGCSSLKKIPNIENNIITLKVAKGCNKDNMYDYCKGEFKQNIKVEETE